METSNFEYRAATNENGKYNERNVESIHFRGENAVPGPLVGRRKGPDNSCMTFLANIGVVVLTILNILTLLMAIGLIVISARLKEDIYKHEEVMKLLALVDFGSFTLKQILDILFGVVLGCGIFGIVTSLLGGVGGFFGFRVLLIIYIIILIIVIIFEIAILSLWIDFLNKANNELKTLFEDLLKEYTGFNDISVYTVGWDLVFIFFGCCGVAPVDQFYNDFQALPTVWWSSGSRGSDVIPFACCQDANIENYLAQNNTACTQNLLDYNESGCYDIFDEIFTKLGSAAISVTVLLVLVEGVAIFFSVIITAAVSTGRKVGIV